MANVNEHSKFHMRMFLGSVNERQFKAFCLMIFQSCNTICPYQIEIWFDFTIFYFLPIRINIQSPFDNIDTDFDTKIVELH